MTDRKQVNSKPPVLQSLHTKNDVTTSNCVTSRTRVTSARPKKGSTDLGKNEIGVSSGADVVVQVIPLEVLELFGGEGDPRSFVLFMIRGLESVVVVEVEWRVWVPAQSDNIRYSSSRCWIQGYLGPTCELLPVK